MSVGMTLSEVEQRVAKACVDLLRERVKPDDGETDVKAVARVANIPPGHVTQCLRRWGIMVSAGNSEIAWTQDNLDELEAHVLLPIVEPVALPSQQFNVNAGHGSQLQVGNSVSGSQTMATYQQILEQLKNEIERSPMPEAEKQTVLQKLGEVMKSPGVAALINLGATIVRSTVGG
jgi:hypothetical protein